MHAVVSGINFRVLYYLTEVILLSMLLQYDSCGKGLGTRLTADTVVGVSSRTRKFTLAVAWGGVLYLGRWSHGVS